MHNGGFSIPFLGANDPFPDPRKASADGIVALGGTLSWQNLLNAYQKGIFPWFSEGDPNIWWSPDPRMVIKPHEFRPSKSLRKLLRQEVFGVTFNQAFDEVIKHCSQVPRPDQEGTWITQEIETAYKELHLKGWARSVEVWQEGQLVGGLYGVDLKDKKIFCGESMFSLVSNASKVAFAALTHQLVEQEYALIDCQLYNDHLASLGAYEISRDQFLDLLEG